MPRHRVAYTTCRDVLTTPGDASLHLAVPHGGRNGANTPRPGISGQWHASCSMSRHNDMRREGQVMDEFNRRALELDGRNGSGLMLFVAGAVIGAAAALILAPTTGRDARAAIGRRGKEISDDVATKGKKLWDEHGDRITG